MTLKVKRGRPTADNDNTAAFAERADIVRNYRSQGLTFRDIADRMSIDARTVRRAISPHRRNRPPLAANDNKSIRLVANNGGCSTTSGMVPVSVVRVPTMELAEIGSEIRVAA